MSRVFGQVTKRRRDNRSRYQAQFGSNHSKLEVTKTDEEILAEQRAQYRRKKHAEGEQRDIDFGYERFSYKSRGNENSRRGWLFNILPTVSTSFS